MKKYLAIFLVLLAGALLTLNLCLGLLILAPRPVEPTPIAILEPSPVVHTTPSVGLETYGLLQETTIPERDLRDLAIRLQGLPPDVPGVVCAENTDLPLGTRRVFHVINTDSNERFTLEAELRYTTAHLYMWVEMGQPVDERDLRAAAEHFEDNTYPTVREFFGSEWSPGVDCDPHLSILHGTNFGSVAGYYSSADEVPSQVRQDSNAMEMFYISLDNVEINSDFYHSVLAHEFQHMIHWYHDSNEESWINEGSSELAAFLNGYDGGFVGFFTSAPDTQLNTWSDEPEENYPHYGAGTLFMLYFLDRFGEEATRRLVAHPGNGWASVQAVLDELRTGLTAEDLFAQWVAANYVDQPGIAQGQYGYQNLEVDRPRLDRILSRYPASAQASVQQFATDYLELRSAGGDVLIQFSGSTSVPVVEAQPHSGRYAWWSNRSDSSDMTLTRAFDLAGLESATLEFWTWYHIEEDYDYVYVEISTDGGRTWILLRGPSMRGANPTGNNYGFGYTGISGGGVGPDWIREEIDLTPYRGGEVLLRFEYVTDDAVNNPGFLVDDIAIPELGYAYAAEEDGDWEAAGFVRMDNLLPQLWRVQLIEYRGRQIVVRPMPLDVNQQGELRIENFDGGEVERAALVISATTPFTTEVATYEYSIRRLD